MNEYIFSKESCYRAKTRSGKVVRGFYIRLFRNKEIDRRTLSFEKEMFEKQRERVSRFFSEAVASYRDRKGSPCHCYAIVGEKQQWYFDSREDFFRSAGSIEEECDISIYIDDSNRLVLNVHNKKTHELGSYKIYLLSDAETTEVFTGREALGDDQALRFDGVWLQDYVGVYW